MNTNEIDNILDYMEMYDISYFDAKKKIEDEKEQQKIEEYEDYLWSLLDAE